MFIQVVIYKYLSLIVTSVYKLAGSDVVGR